jgi:two-component system response regulator QseB
MAKILIIDDDRNLSYSVSQYLAAQSHAVEMVHTATDGLERLCAYDYDLVVLDWMLPETSGIELCRQYREQQGVARVLMLTGKNQNVDKVTGLDSGADDYLTKPFEPSELGARVRALLRRPVECQSTLIRHGDLELDATKGIVRKAGNELSLNRKEFALLDFFMRHPSQLFSPDALLERVWSSESETSTQAVKVYVNRLRQQIDAGRKESYIVTMHGSGYRFEPSSS